MGVGRFCNACTSAGCEHVTIGGDLWLLVATLFAVEHQVIFLCFLPESDEVINMLMKGSAINADVTVYVYDSW